MFEDARPCTGRGWGAWGTSDAPQLAPQRRVRNAASKISSPRASLVEGWAKVRGRGGRDAHRPHPTASGQAGARSFPGLGMGAFLPPQTRRGLPRGRDRDPTPPAPPPSPQAWLRSGAGWRESFSLNQYNLPSGSREQICSHLKAASVFPDYEGVSGALFKSRKVHIPKGKQTPSSGGPGRAGQEPRSGWGRGWPPLWAWERTGRRWTGGRAAQAKPARGLRIRSSYVYW